MPWDQTDDYIRSGHKDPDKYDTCRTITISDKDGIKAIYCRLKGTEHEWEIQSYLFARDKGWTIDKARDWFNKHKEAVKVKDLDGKVIRGYTITVVSKEVLLDYGAMNYYAAKVIGFTPLPKKDEIFLREDDRGQEIYDDIDHEITEAELMKPEAEGGKGLSYWDAHKKALKKEKETVSESLIERHLDFQKIYTQFQTRYCTGANDDTTLHLGSCVRGDSKYHQWLQTLGLDDTKAYGEQMFKEHFRGQEDFKWAEPTIAFLKKEGGKQIFACEALFPLTSMNNNVYTDDELVRGTRTLKGVPVNLNHTSVVLLGVEVPDAEYKDGAAECILSVDETAKCPVCNKEYLLVDMFNRSPDIPEESHIYHVSIEADCRRSEPNQDGQVCKGLFFTGLAALTKKFLPGVPLTTISRVESIVAQFTTNEKDEQEMDETNEEGNVEIDVNVDDAMKMAEAEKAKKAAEAALPTSPDSTTKTDIPKIPEIIPSYPVNSPEAAHSDEPSKPGYIPTPPGEIDHVQTQEPNVVASKSVSTGPGEMAPLTISGDDITERARKVLEELKNQPNAAKLAFLKIAQEILGPQT